MANLYNRPAIESIVFYFFFGLVILSTSCSKKIFFLTSAEVPAARGTVQIKMDKNNNNEIDIQITELAEVSRLQPAKQTYVVWLITDQNITKNIGQLVSEKSGLSKTLKASFKTVTALKPTKIFITAENEPNSQYPNEPILLTTDYFNN